MPVQAGNVLLIGLGHTLLGLRDCQIIGNAGFVPLLGLVQRFIRQVHITLCHFNQLFRGLNVEYAVANVGANLPSQVAEPRALLFQLRLGLLRIAAQLCFLEERHVQRAASVAGSMRMGRVDSNIPVVAVEGDCGQALVGCSLARAIGGRNLLLERLQIRARGQGLLHGLIRIDVIERGVRFLVAQLELLLQRQANRTRQRNLVLLISIAIRNQRLFLGLVVDTREQLDKQGRGTGLMIAHRLIERNLRGIHLGLGGLHQGCICDDRQIRIPHR